MSGQTQELPAQLRRRKEPHQDRSRDAVERILNASLELLSEFGVEKLTTRRIAARAEVNVSTLYQFFPNKHAIIYALYEDWLKTSKSVFKDADVALNACTDWRHFFTDLMQSMACVGLSADTKTSLKQAMTVYEDLRKLDDEHVDWAIAKIGSYLDHYGPICSDECKRSLAILLMERDQTLATHEQRHGREVTSYLTKLTRDALLHLLAQCIEDGKVCQPTSAS